MSFLLFCPDFFFSVMEVSFVSPVPISVGSTLFYGVRKRRKKVQRRKEQKKSARRNQIKLHTWSWWPQGRLEMKKNGNTCRGQEYFSFGHGIFLWFFVLPGLLFCFFAFTITQPTTSASLQRKKSLLCESATLNDSRKSSSLTIEKQDSCSQKYHRAPSHSICTAIITFFLG